MPTQSTTSPLIIIVIILAGFVAGYFYYAQIGTADLSEVAPILNIGRNDDLSKFENITFPTKVLEANSYRNLRVFGEAPVQPGFSGRPDIFAPF